VAPRISNGREILESSRSESQGRVRQEFTGYARSIQPWLRCFSDQPCHDLPLNVKKAKAPRCPLATWILPSHIAPGTRRFSPSYNFVASATIAGCRSVFAGARFGAYRGRQWGLLPGRSRLAHL